MVWVLLAIVYVSTLAFVGYVLWLKRDYSKIEQHVVELKNEINALNTAAGLRKAQGMPFMGGPPPSR